MRFNQWISVLAASSIACGVTTLGIYIISRFAAWSRRNSVYFMSFAAGVLLTVSFVHLIPRAMSMNEDAPVYLLLGFMALYLSNYGLNQYLDREEQEADVSLGIVPVLGIGVHSFLDGVIYSITFNVSIFTGALAAVGMIFHEFPEGIVTFVLLQRGGFSRKKAVRYAFLAAGFSTPLGAIVSYPFLRTIADPNLGALLALSGGALVYVGAAHLLPEVEERNIPASIFALIGGILVGLVIILSHHGGAD
jgi:zinc transporter ZupT